MSISKTSEKLSRPVGVKPALPKSGGNPIAPSTISSSGQPSAKPKAVKPDSAGKLAVKNLQSAILYFKTSLEQLDIASKENPGVQTSKQRRLDNVYSPNFQHPEFMEGAIRSMNPYSGLYKDIEPLTEQERKDREDKEMLGGTNPMGNFLINNYIPSTALSYADVDSPEKTRNKTGPGGAALKQFDFRSLVESIGHVGSPKPERKPTNQEILLQKQIDNILKRYNPKKIEEFKNKVSELSKNYYNNTGVFATKSRHDANNSALKLKRYQDEYNKLDRIYNINNPNLIKLNNQLSALKTKLDSEYQKKNPELGEESIDGIYHIRTSNALKIIGSIVQGFLTFAKDMGQPSQKYTQGSLNKYLDLVEIFNQLIDTGKNLANTEIKIKGVNELAKNIYAQASFIKDEFLKVIQSDNVKSFVKQENSFMVFNKTNMKAKSDEAKKTQELFKERFDQNTKTLYPSNEDYVNHYKNNFQDGTSGIKVNMNNKEVVLSYDSLWTTDNLANTYKSYFGKKPTKEELSQFLDKITETMNSAKRMNSYTIDPTQIVQPPSSPEKPRKPWEALYNARLPKFKQ